MKRSRRKYVQLKKSTPKKTSTSFITPFGCAGSILLFSAFYLITLLLAQITDSTSVSRSRSWENDSGTNSLFIIMFVISGIYVWTELRKPSANKKANTTPSKLDTSNTSQVGIETVSGYVYIIQDTSNTGYYKIGRTNNLDRRLGSEFTKFPFDWKVIQIIPSQDEVQLERELHRMFAAKRKRGEWYDLAGSDLFWLQDSFPSDEYGSSSAR